MSRFYPFIELAGRILIGVLFIGSGMGKITAYAATAGYMASVGVPAWMLPLVILTEVGGALCLFLGFQTRIVAFLLAGFTIVAACIFHSNFADQMQMINFMKNVAITGGLLQLVVHGAGRFSLDHRFASK